MIHDEIISTLDEIDRVETESYVEMMSTFANLYEKENMMIEECCVSDTGYYQESANETNKKPANIFKKILNMIKHLFQMIKNQIEKLIAMFATKRRKHSTSVNSVILKILNESEYNKPDDINSWPIPKINPKYMSKQNKPKSNDKDSEVVTESYKETPITNKANGPVRVRIPAGKDSLVTSQIIEVPTGDIVAGFDEKKKSIRFMIFGSGKMSNVTAITSDKGEKINIQKTKNTWFDSPKTALYLIGNPDEVTRINELVTLALKIMKHGKQKDIDQFNDTCENTLKDIYKKASKLNTKIVDVSMTDLTNFQKELNKMNYKMDEFVDIANDISDMDKKTMKNMNLLTTKLLRIQMSLNMLTSALDNKNIINSQFIGCIKSVAMLDLFVKGCVDAGIPPKYIGYNAWLVSDPCIKGDNPEFAPVWGQTRIVFFPPGKRVVYKVALSGAGITSNQAEIRTSKLFVDMDRVDLIAPIVRTWKNDAVVAMECVKSQGKPSYANLLAYTKDVNDVIKEYEKKNNVKINTKISDQHKDNVKYDIVHGVYRSIDYGIAKRSS